MRPIGMPPRTRRSGPRAHYAAAVLGRSVHDSSGSSSGPSTGTSCNLHAACHPARRRPLTTPGLLLLLWREVSIACGLHIRSSSCITLMPFGTAAGALCLRRWFRCCDMRCYTCGIAGSRRRSAPARHGQLSGQLVYPRNKGGRREGSAQGPRSCRRRWLAAAWGWCSLLLLRVLRAGAGACLRARGGACCRCPTGARAGGRSSPLLLLLLPLLLLPRAALLIVLPSFCMAPQREPAAEAAAMA